MFFWTFLSLPIEVPSYIILKIILSTTISGKRMRASILFFWSFHIIFSTLLLNKIHILIMLSLEKWFVKCMQISALKIIRVLI